MHYLPETIRTALSRLLASYNVPLDDADITATILLEGTLRGYTNHGIDRISQIIEGFENGTLCPRPERTVIRSGPSFAILSAGYGLGQPSGVQAMKLAIERSRDTGIGLAGVVNGGHLGILSYYAEMASYQRCLGMVFSTTSPAAVVPGGGQKILGTNPIAYSLPIDVDGSVMTADFSTTTVSRSTLLECRAKNCNIPLGWAVNAEGNPTEDPTQALEGGLLPHGGDIKGTLLSLLVAILAGPLISGVANHTITGTRYMDKMPTKADLFLCMDVSQLTDVQDFTRETASLLQTMVQSSSNFYVPGKGSQQRRAKNAESPLAVSSKTKALLLPYLD